MKIDVLKLLREQLDGGLPEGVESIRVQDGKMYIELDDYADGGERGTLYTVEVTKVEPPK